MRIRRSTWSVDVSDEWSVTDHPECLTLEISEHGALQLSSAQKQVGLVTEEDIFFSEEQRQAWGPWQPAACGEFSGIFYEYREDESIWQRWFLRWGQTLLFITYNGTSAATERERSAIERVLNSVRTEAGGEA